MHQILHVSGWFDRRVFVDPFTILCGAEQAIEATFVAVPKASGPSRSLSSQDLNWQKTGFLSARAFFITSRRYRRRKSGLLISSCIRYCLTKPSLAAIALHLNETSPAERGFQAIGKFGRLIS
ncbi:hypothetical protein ABW19_dt0200959 [Dactylella cylindrospora]|nr:hypothetical protein ABW19_dt0200959 [Dactylella cylindrospora]